MPGSTTTVTGASGNVGAAPLDVLETDPGVAGGRAGLEPTTRRAPTAALRGEGEPPEAGA